MHLWRAGDVQKVDAYLEDQGLRRNPAFPRLLQALIELARNDNHPEETALLERIMNHVTAHGAHPQMREGWGLEQGNGRVAMTRQALLSRIAIAPNVCFGKPCIRGTRIWVPLILDFPASGWTVQDLLREYPDLEEADVRACLAYGAELARERFVDIPLETAR